MAAEGAEDREEERPRRRRRSSSHWYWLFLVPFAALLYPPLYAHVSPHIWGIPFFYWYQVVWLAITAVISVTIYRRVR